MKNLCEECADSAPVYLEQQKKFPMANQRSLSGRKYMWCSPTTITMTVTLQCGFQCPRGLQAALIKNEPAKFFMPPYVATGGWVGIDLDSCSDEELAFHICEAWRLIAPKKVADLSVVNGAQPRLSGERLPRKIQSRTLPTVCAEHAVVNSRIKHTAPVASKNT